MSLTVFSGLILSSSKTSANTSASASITVAAACSLNATTDSDHSANIFPGTYQSEIGSTTFTIVCNDIEGYSVYAVGYSNNEFGNNKLLATVNNVLTPTYDINTGTNTSGTPSSWSMKLTPGTGLTASNILNNYNNYNAVPSQYVKVATLIPATNSSTNNTSTFSSTYAVNIASTQSAGAYAGKVKYTMVNPASDVPIQPYVTEANAAGYYPNANGVLNTMGKQNISATATTATLWASNYKRPGYGFAGWSDKYDWVINENDINGNGTGPNEGYHIYGPNQDITFTAGQYSGTNQGLSLYAVWVKSQGAIQNWNGCSAMNIGEVTALTDLRDKNTYAVAKLADGNCWMIENLRLDNQYTVGAEYEALAQGYAKSTTYGDFIGLAAPETTNFSFTNITAITTTAANSIYYAGIQSGTATIDIGTSNNPGVRFPRFNNQNTASPDVQTTTSDGNIYSYGNYYTWSAAIADTGHYTTWTYSYGYDITATSICPKGWRFPSGGVGTKITNSGSDFWKLGLDIMGFAPSNRSYYQDLTEINTDGKTAIQAYKNYPNNFVKAGAFSEGGFAERGKSGRYMASTVYGNDHSFMLFLDERISTEDKNLHPGTAASQKYIGNSIRCLTDS